MSLNLTYSDMERMYELHAARHGTKLFFSSGHAERLSLGKDASEAVLKWLSREAGGMLLGDVTTILLEHANNFGDPERREFNAQFVRRLEQLLTYARSGFTPAPQQ